MHHLNLTHHQTTPDPEFDPDIHAPETEITGVAPTEIPEEPWVTMIGDEDPD